MKKTLAVLLAITMVLTMMPSIAFAATELVSKNVTVGSVIFDGTEQEPTVKVVVGSKKLTEGTDYTVEFSDNVNVGTATATVTGKGNYSGTVTKNFTINPLPLSKVKIELKEGEGVYGDDFDGKVLASYDMFQVTYNDVDVSHLVDFKSAYTSSNTKVRVTVSSSNDNITGSKYADFAIMHELNATDFTVAEIRDQIYTGEEIEPTVTVKGSVNGKTVTLKKGTDYELSYVDNVDVGIGTVVITGKGAYSGELSQIFNINQRAINASGITFVMGNALYEDGAVVTPNIVIFDGERMLEEDSDYFVVCDATAKGTATATIYGSGNYDGSVDKKFTVVEKTFDNADIEIKIGSKLAEDYEADYNGSAIKPTITVKMDGKTLSSSNYTVSYADNIKVGEAKIIITGKGSYAGKAETTFEIVETSIRAATVSGFNEEYEYTGKAIEPAVVVTVDGHKLVKDEDYTVSYVNNEDISTKSYNATIIIEAIDGSGYVGTRREYFDIIGKSIKDCSAKIVGGSSVAYNGYALYPEVEVTDGKTELEEGEDFEVYYKDAAGKIVSSIRDTGKFTVVVEGINNYGGEKELSFTVTGNDISGYTVVLEDSTVTANGKVQNPVIKSVKRGSTTLDEYDYTVSYKDADGKVVKNIIEPGTYTVVVSGTNGYSGDASATYRVKGKAQTITVEDTAFKVYVDSEPFKIEAKATGDGTGFSYVSSNPEVASVSSRGVVTVHKLGRAKITVTTTGMTMYDPASEEVIVKVYPDKALIAKKPWTEGKKGSLRVRWNIQEDTTSYQIRYSTTSDFKTYKTKTVKASELYDTQSTRISGLEANTKYYIKVRAVKSVYNDNGKELKYYGKWSNWRSGVTE